MYEGHLAAEGVAVDVKNLILFNVPAQRPNYFKLVEAQCASALTLSLSPRPLFFWRPPLPLSLRPPLPQAQTTASMSCSQGSNTLLCRTSACPLAPHTTNPCPSLPFTERMLLSWKM